MPAANRTKSPPPVRRRRCWDRVVASREAEGGFTLIEVLVALVIISVGLFALLTVFISSLRSVQEQEAHSLATRVGTETIEEFRGKAFEDIAVGDDDDRPDDYERTVDAGGREFAVTIDVTWDDAVAEQADGGGDGDGDEEGAESGLKRVEVTVAWDVLGNERSNTFATAIASGQGAVPADQPGFRDARIKPDPVPFDDDGDLEEPGQLELIAEVEGFDDPQVSAVMGGPWEDKEVALSQKSDAFGADVSTDPLQDEDDLPRSVPVEFTVTEGSEGKATDAIGYWLDLDLPSDLNPDVQPTPIPLSLMDADEGPCGDDPCHVNDEAVALEVRPDLGSEWEDEDATFTVAFEDEQGDTREEFLGDGSDLNDDSLTATIADGSVALQPNSTVSFEFAGEGPDGERLTQSVIRDTSWDDEDEGLIELPVIHSAGFDPDPVLVNRTHGNCTQADRCLPIETVTFEIDDVTLGSRESDDVRAEVIVPANRDENKILGLDSEAEASSVWSGQIAAQHEEDEGQQIYDGRDLEFRLISTDSEEEVLDTLEMPISTEEGN